jgi:hypothetical protein
MGKYLSKAKKLLQARIKDYEEICAKRTEAWFPQDKVGEYALVKS